jgi:hypothetical protein
MRDERKLEKMREQFARQELKVKRAEKMLSHQRWELENIREAYIRLQNGVAVDPLAGSSAADSVAAGKVRG